MVWLFLGVELESLILTCIDLASNEILISIIEIKSIRKT